MTASPAERPDRKEPAFQPGERVAVIGLGASGEAASRLAADRGGRVYASDVSATEGPSEAAGRLREAGIDAEAGGHDLERILAADLVVVSPGVAPSAEVRRRIREAGLRIISEAELAYRELTSRIVAITGTNGKTTTTAVTGHLLGSCGFDAATGGNIGRPLSEIALREEHPEWVVVEVSSFQLADIESFRPDIGVLLNLAPDHLDRYRDVDRYYSDKARLFDNADEECAWVLNADDEAVLDLARNVAGREYHFSLEARPEQGAWLDEEGWLRLDLPDRSERWIRSEELPLLGAHNTANALAAGVAVALMECGPDHLADGLRSFEGLPHRLQPVLRREDVLWVNDSKATNVSATRVALRAFDRPVILILGGRHKGESYDELGPELRDRVRTVLVYGEAAPQIVADLQDQVEDLRVAAGLGSVVRQAASLARAGDVVLFSPACSSFDLFPSYEVRGQVFAETVRSLEDGPSAEGAP